MCDLISLTSCLHNIDTGNIVLVNSIYTFTKYVINQY